MQDLTTFIAAQVAADASKPIILVEIGLDAGTLRFAATNVDVVFPIGGNTYYAKAMQIGDINFSIDSQIVECEISLDNIAKDMHGYNAAEKFDGKSIVVKKTYLPISASATDYRERFNGVMEEPKFPDKRWCRIKCTTGRSLRRKALSEYYNWACQRLFGDAMCNQDGYADLTTLTHTGTVTTAGAASIRDTGLTQADDYWNYGRIEMTIDGIKYYRRVNDFDSTTDQVYFDVPMHTSVPVGTAYTITKGCALTLDACRATYAYGPSDDNEANFKGFVHIGDK
jgi:hypothetical protein